MNGNGENKVQFGMMMSDVDWLKSEFTELNKRFDTLDGKVDGLSIATAVSKMKLSVIVAGIATCTAGIVSWLVRRVS
jgi:hypothetical protein